MCPLTIQPAEVTVRRAGATARSTTTLVIFFSKCSLTFDYLTNLTILTAMLLVESYCVVAGVALQSMGTVSGKASALGYIKKNISCQ